MLKKSLALMTVAAASLLGACAAPDPRPHEVVVERPGPERAHFGYVRDIDVIPVASRPTGAGAVLGAVIGGVVGNQIGSGSGCALATGAGVVGGAVVGNQIEKHNRRDDEVFRVTVRMDNGNTRVFDYREVGGLRVGDRVKIESGELQRV